MIHIELIKVLEFIRKVRGSGKPDLLFSGKLASGKLTEADNIASFSNACVNEQTEDSTKSETEYIWQRLEEDERNSLINKVVTAENLYSSSAAAMAATKSILKIALFTDTIKQPENLWASFTNINTPDPSEETAVVNGSIDSSAVIDEAHLLTPLVDVLKNTLFGSTCDRSLAIIAVELLLIITSSTPEIYTKIASAEIGLLPLLIDWLRLNIRSVYIDTLLEKVLRMLANLSKMVENRVSMASDEAAGLLSLLLNIVRSRTDKSQDIAFRILLNLSVAVENKYHMGLPDVGVLPLLVEVLQTGRVRGHIRECAVKCLSNLAVLPENAARISSPAMGLLPIIFTIVSNERGLIRANALGTMLNISRDMQNIPLQMVTKWLHLLLQVAREDNGLARENAIATLSNIAWDRRESKIDMASPELGLFPALRDALKGDDAVVKAKTLMALLNISVAKESRLPMAATDIGLVEVLVTVVNSNDDDDDEAMGMSMTAMGILSNIAIVRENKTRLASPELGLVPVLAKTAGSAQKDVRSRAIGILASLANAPENVPLLMTPELDILNILEKVLLEDCGEIKALALGAIANLTVISDIEKLSVGGLSNISPTFVKLIVKAAKKRRSSKKWKRVYALRSLDNLSLLPECRMLMLSEDEECDVPAMLIKIIREESDSSSRAAALKILWNLTHLAEFDQPLAIP